MTCGIFLLKRNGKRTSYNYNQKMTLYSEEGNRDRGRCKICGETLRSNYRHCQRIDERLPLDKINKVPNLAWFCYNCLKIVQSGEIPQGINSKMKLKFLLYHKKLKVLN